MTVLASPYGEYGKAELFYKGLEANMIGHVVPFFIHAITPLHVGAGRGVRFIDLPVIREKATGWPIVPGSSIKGVLADYHGATDEGRDQNEKLRAAFGRADKGALDQGMPNAGSLVFTDAKVLCMPVRSFYGTFAWITSPLALKRFLRDMKTAGDSLDIDSIPEPPTQQTLLGTNNSALQKDYKVYLEDNDFSFQPDDRVRKFGEKIAQAVYKDNHGSWIDEFLKRFAIVTDDTFDFFCELGTEVRARIRIDQDTKTVQEGALWYEEALPAETILAGIVWCDKVYGAEAPEPSELLNDFCSNTLTLQLGGGASIGKGLVKMIFQNGGD